MVKKEPFRDNIPAPVAVTQKPDTFDMADLKEYKNINCTKLGCKMHESILSLLIDPEKAQFSEATSIAKKHAVRRVTQFDGSLSFVKFKPTCSNEN